MQEGISISVPLKFLAIAAVGGRGGSSGNDKYLDWDCSASRRELAFSPPAVFLVKIQSTPAICLVSKKQTFVHLCVFTNKVNVLCWELGGHIRKAVQELYLPPGSDLDWPLQLLLTNTFKRQR